MQAHYYFKLDPNVRNPTEVYFGKMEIEGLLNREVQPIRHFYDVLKDPPVSYFDNDSVRIQDYMLNLRTAYGGIQGYYYSGKLARAFPLYTFMIALKNGNILTLKRFA